MNSLKGATEATKQILDLVQPAGKTLMTDEDKGKVLREFAAKMQKIRDAQPTEADVRAVKNEVEFLLGVAEGDTGQSTRVRNFLLAWWNAEECGGFDLTDLWNVDMEIVEAIQRILFVLPNYRFYPDRLGFGERFERMARERIAARQGVK